MFQTTNQQPIWEWFINECTLKPAIYCELVDGWGWLMIVYPSLHYSRYESIIRWVSCSAMITGLPILHYITQTIKLFSWDFNSIFFRLHLALHLPLLSNGTAEDVIVPNCSKSSWSHKNLHPYHWHSEIYDWLDWWWSSSNIFGKIKLSFSSGFAAILQSWFVNAVIQIPQLRSETLVKHGYAEPLGKRDDDQPPSQPSDANC